MIKSKQVKTDKSFRVVAQVAKIDKFLSLYARCLDLYDKKVISTSEIQSLTIPLFFCQNCIVQPMQFLGGRLNSFYEFTM